MVTREENLLGWARDAGFDLAGIARLGEAAHGREFQAWLARGDHASMSYLERQVEDRLDPRRLLDGARSALVVGWRYAPLSPPAEATQPHGDLWPRVARYARGDDYHDTLKARLNELAARIQAGFPGVATRVGVDTSAILERDLGAAAGIGWIGKNTLLIHERVGSWFLIGEILTTLELEPNDPMADRCGTCTRCLDACPTGALPEPYRLDANRCISYWTIEHRGEFAPEVARSIGDWVFGCDICQEACPWNRKPEAVDAPEFALPARRAVLDLAGLLDLPREEYVERFRGSPMKRAKLEGLQRNARAVLANRERESG
jgi:epoxyqueuosine reductase